MKTFANAVLCGCLLLASGFAVAADDMKKAEPAAAKAAAPKGPTLRECRANRAAIKKATKAGTPVDDAMTQKKAACDAVAKKREANLNKAAPADPTQR